MKRTLLLILICCFTVVTTACPRPEADARDASAALKGLIESAQSQYQASCTANPQQTVCQSINKAVAGENALITSLEAYCGWSAAMPPPDPSTPCVPVKTAQGALQSATSNANLFITELRGILSTPPTATPAKGVTP